MQERAADMRFAGGALVFPGGAVDKTDLALAHELLAGFASDVDELAARIAAVRETIEECGLLLTANCKSFDDETAVAFRHALKSGSGLGNVARASEITFDFDRLVAFARWCPSASMGHKRFDTRFFLTVLEEEEATYAVSPDGSESVRLAWHSAREVLEEADAERVKIIFPTRRNLERLAQYETVEALLDHVRRYPVDTITPWVETRDGADHLCIPEGMGYPVTSEPLGTAKRT